MKEYRFVGFGFGAIQAGLFLYEGQQSGCFAASAVAEIDAARVEALRRNGGCFSVNIAHSSHIESATLGPADILNPNSETDREHLIEQIAAATHIATAIPSVAYYRSDAPGSLHRVLAAGLTRKLELGGPPAVIMTAENHNHAAELLLEALAFELDDRERAQLPRSAAVLNTVIGKMSSVVDIAVEQDAGDLPPIVPGGSEAFLVERFNRILTSRVPDWFDHDYLTHAFPTFEQKNDLYPFEESKLYGHNATHALAGYLSALRGVRSMAELREMPGMMQFLRDAFLRESGGALIRKYGGTDAPFTEEGYAAYVDDLLERMTNPHLRTPVEHVTRDPVRKLGWDDRLIGTVRLALAHGIQPVRYAVGAAAALSTFVPSGEASPDVVRDLFQRTVIAEPTVIGSATSDLEEYENVLAAVLDGYRRLGIWTRSESSDPQVML